jgi:hypothetical protein
LFYQQHITNTHTQNNTKSLSLKKSICRSLSPPPHREKETLQKKPSRPVQTMGCCNGRK